jgi:predicted enzyme related to lactoylglutathione lyase
MISIRARESLENFRTKLKSDPQGLVEASDSLTRLAEADPRNAWLLAEIGGVFDSCGFEQEACMWYERALSLGEDKFPMENLPDFYVGCGSTLRNIGRLAESESVLRKALGRWPNSSALQFFLGLTLKSQGRAHEAISALVALHVGSWDNSVKSYTRAIQTYWEKELEVEAARPSVCWVRLCVESVEVSTRWYAKVLDIPPNVLTPTFGLITLGATRIEFAPSDEKNPKGRGGAVGYLHVKDLEATIARFEQNGAEIYRGPLPVPEEGLTICQMLDPYGNVLGLVGPS